MFTCKQVLSYRLSHWLVVLHLLLINGCQKYRQSVYSSTGYVCLLRETAQKRKKHGQRKGKQSESNEF